MKVNPYHSKKNLGVYHVCNRCTQGNNIELENKRPGMGGGRLCQTCKRLTLKGGC